MSITDRFVRMLTAYPAVSLGTGVLIIVLMMIFMRIPAVDSSLHGYDVDNNPYYLTGKQMMEQFGSGNMIEVQVDIAQTGGALFLKGLEDLAEAIRGEYPMARVESVHKAGMLLRLKAGPQAGTRELLIAAKEIPVIKNLVSKDTLSVMLVVFAGEGSAFDTDHFDSILSPPYDGILSLTPMSQFHIQSQLEKTIARDYMILLPVTILLIGLYLGYSYKSARAVVYCLTHVIIAVVTALFYFSLFGIIINQITTTVIPIAAILSISASVHLLTGYVHRDISTAEVTGIEKALGKYLIPSFLSAFTTAIAFGSFVLSDSLYIRQFGLMTAITVMTVFMLTYMLAPLFLTFVRTRSRLDHSFSNFFKDFIVRHNRSIALIMIVVMAGSLIVVPRITFRTNLETFLPRHTPVYYNNQKIKESFHSLAAIDLMIEPRGEQVTTRGELVTMVSDFSRTIGSYNQVSGVESLADQLAFESDFKAPGAIIFPRSTNPFVSKNQRKYRIHIKLKDAADIWEVKQKLAVDFAPYQQRYSYSTYSDFFFFHHINNMITQSLLKSLVFSGLLIMLVVLILTRSLRLTAVTLLSNLIPLGFLVWAMVLFDTGLSIAASMTLVISLGLIVDDSIHILYRCVRLREPLGELGFGIVTTSILLGGGFLSFILSQSLPNQIFGALCALAFLMAMISDLAVMSWLIKEK